MPTVTSYGRITTPLAAHVAGTNAIGTILSFLFNTYTLGVVHLVYVNLL